MAHGAAAVNPMLQPWSPKDQDKNSQHTVEESLISEQAALLMSRPRGKQKDDNNAVVPRSTP